MKEFWRSIKFLLFSISAGIIQIISFTLLNEILHLDYWLSYLIALVLSVLWNFTFNRKFTFKSASNVPKAMLLVFLFYLVFTPLSTMLENYLTSLGWNEYLVTVINMVINFILEFLYQRFVVFKNSIDSNSFTKNIHVSVNDSGHIQGIAIDEKRKYIYCSFTTEFAKFDMKGNKVASVKGLVGHLGCIAYNYDDGKVYGSLEFKNDSIGKGILAHIDGETKFDDGFYCAIFDVEKMTELDMDAETSGIMKTVYLKEVTDDYTNNKYGTSGIDGTTFAPQIGEKDGKKYIYIAYGIYSDTERTDNDNQIILQYDVSSWDEYARPLNQKDMHKSGPEKPNNKYYVHTGNTNFGIQNLEYDPNTNYLIAAVYKGQKEQYPNYKMFVFDCNQEPYKDKNPDGEDVDFIHIAEIGLHDEKTNIHGFNFDLGSTGIASLGYGYFYISNNKEDWKNRVFESDISLYSWDGKTPFVKL